MAHSQGWKQYLRKNAALLCIHSARQQLACCVNSLWGPIILSWFWKQCARRGLHSYQNSVLFPFFPFSEIDVSEVGEGTFSSLVSEKGYCRMLRFSWSGQFFVCFWNLHGVFDQNSLRLRKSDPLYIHRNATKRLHWVWVPQRTSAFPQHVLWVTPYLSLHSNMSGTGFTTVFCANLVSFRRSQASGTWGWCHRLLLWFAGLRRCLSKADAGRRVHGVRNAPCMSWPAYLLPRKQVTHGASKLNCQAVCSFCFCEWGIVTDCSVKQNHSSHVRKKKHNYTHLKGTAREDKQNDILGNSGLTDIPGYIWNR